MLLITDQAIDQWRNVTTECWQQTICRLLSNHMVSHNLQWHQLLQTNWLYNMCHVWNYTATIRRHADRSKHRPFNKPRGPWV